tara:strand:- start:1513 stop:1836 length:324 start_codon:yes stop_codon:yes gene_type:complete
MSFEKSDKEIEDKVIINGGVSWNALLELKHRDNRHETDNFKRAMARVLVDRRVTTLEPFENYFIHFQGLEGVAPAIEGFLYYFPEKDDAKFFRNIFYPGGLVARVEE